MCHLGALWSHPVTGALKRTQFSLCITVVPGIDISLSLSFSLSNHHTHTFPTDNYSTTIVLIPGQDLELPVVGLNSVATVPQRSGSRVCLCWHGCLSVGRDAVGITGQTAIDHHRGSLGKCSTWPLPWSLEQTKIKTIQKNKKNWILIFLGEGKIKKY